MVRIAVIWLLTFLMLPALNIYGQNNTPYYLPEQQTYTSKDSFFLNKELVNAPAIRGFNLKLGSVNNWLQCILVNRDTIARDAIVELTNPFLNRVSFYTVDSSLVKDSLTVGALLPFVQRQKDHPNFQYTVSLQPGQIVTCMLRIDVGPTSGDFRLLVWDKEQRATYQVMETKYLSYFFIINISFLLLIGIAILLTRQRYHWYYFIYALFGFIYIYVEVGLAFKNIWPDDPVLQNASILLIANIYQVFGLLFVRKYFNTSVKSPFYDKLLTILILSGLVFEAIVGIALLLKSNLPPWLAQVNTALFICSGIGVFIVASVSSRFKTLRSDGIWFMIGFTPHAISILQLCLRPFGLFNNNNELWFKAIAPVYVDTIHPPNFLFWSVLWEVIIVFWLIIKRLRRLYEENNAMVEQLAIQKEKNMRTLLTGIEKERQRIAQELHDGSGVSLSALKMKLHLLKDSTSGNDSAGNVNELMKDVDRIYEDIRNISHNLMPKTLSKLGLYPAIDELLDQFRIAAPQTRFNYYRKISARKLNENATINIFRIIQELLTNVVKHADAKEVSLQLIEHQEALMISVEDDGIGFDTREMKNGIGITSLESRVQMLSGNLSIDSSPQSGTFVSIFVPLKNLN